VVRQSCWPFWQRRNPKGGLLSGWICVVRVRVCAARAPREIFSAGRKRLWDKSGASPAGNKTCLPKPKRKEQVAGEDSAAQGNLRSHSDRFYCARERDDVNKRLARSLARSHSRAQEMNVNQRKLLLIVDSLLHVRNETHTLVLRLF
jgi:hypothetical protein